MINKNKNLDSLKLFSCLIITAYTSLLLSSCIDLSDKRQENEIYNLYNKIYDDKRVGISEIFPGDWDLLCVITPGTAPSRRIPIYLKAQFDDLFGIKDPEEFGEYLWKFILVNKSNNKSHIILLHKRDFSFEDGFCTEFKNKTLHFTKKIEILDGKEKPSYKISVN